MEFGGTNCLAVLVLPVRPSSVRPLHSIITNEGSGSDAMEILIDIVRILIGQLGAWRSRWNAVEQFALWVMLWNLVVIQCHFGLGGGFPWICEHCGNFGGTL